MRALIIASSMESSINDALEAKEILESRNYYTIILTGGKATYDKILKKLSWLAKGEKGILYFTGHSQKGNLLCYDRRLRPKDIERYLIENLRAKVTIILDCCGDIKFKVNPNVTVVRNISKLAYDKVIDGKRRGLLTYYLLGMLRRYNYSIDIRDLEFELNSKLLQNGQVVAITSSIEKIII